MKNRYLGILVILFIVPFSLIISANWSSKEYINYKNSNADSLALNNTFIQLKDGESYKIKCDFHSELDGFGKTSIFDFSSKDFADKPFLIRSYEQHESEFELLTNYSTDNFIQQLFNPQDVIAGEYNYLFNNYKQIHYNSATSPFSESDIFNYNSWRHKLGDDPDNFWWPNIDHHGINEEEIDMMVKIFGGGHADFKGQQLWPLNFFHTLIKEKVARDIILKYVISSYKKIEHKIPLSIKKEILSILNKLLTFLKQDIAILKVDYDNPDWPEIVKTSNYFESFLVRRLHTDRVPISELNSHINTFRSLILNSMISANVSNLFLTNINNDLVIKDHKIHALSISSLKSNKEVVINQGDEIIVKCLVDQGVKYYQFERNGSFGDDNEFLGLYNSNLDVIRPPKK